MGNRLRHLRSAAGAILLGAAGCAFPNGTTGGDPLLGNFNRPIVPTPPPERAGLGPDTPAYDAGARIGVGGPDYSGRTGTLPDPTPGPATGTPTIPGASSTPGTPTTPASPGSTGAPRGARLPSIGAEEMGFVPRTPTSGAQLLMPSAVAKRERPDKSLAAPEGSGPSLPPIRQASHEEPRSSERPETLESARAALEKVSARDMRTELAPDGEWRFECSIGGQAYEGRAGNAVEAMRLVLDQVRQDKK